MNIGSGNAYPANALSNFSPHPFNLDGVEIMSMEGFLQSLKFKNPDVAKEVCKLIGRAAKKRGAPKNWQREQKLYWLGKEYGRSSIDYQRLLDRAYMAMFKQSDSFRKALKASGNANLTHSIGRRNEKETVLTISEFCGRLTKLREML